MTDDSNAPDWSLLPHSPQEFFGLESSFDRKDLKRSYNHLLRQFKPEKYPQEFQRIRGAYEQLDNQLRYGTSMSLEADAGVVYEWTTEESPRKQSDRPTEQVKADSPAQDQRSRRIPLYERVQQEPLADVYRSLSEKKDKSAYDYYSLAVISDIVQRKDGLLFVRWLLAGLKEMPDEHGLFSLLFEYYRSPIPEASLAKILVATSQVVSSYRFFSLTESLWLRLLREKTFEKFQATLEQCETHLQGFDIDGQIAFSIEILKTAIWKGNSKWIEKTLTLIDENFERIPYHLEYDVDVLEWLKKIVDQRELFTSAHPLRLQMEQAICVYYSENQRTGDQKVLECQMAISQDPQMLLEAFPFDSGEDIEPLYLVWTNISYDVAERNVAPLANEHDPDIWASRAHSLVKHLDSKTNLSAQGVRWTLAIGGYKCAIGLLYVSMVLVFFLFLLLGFQKYLPSLSDYRFLLALIPSIIIGLIIGNWLHTRFVTQHWQRYCKRKEIDCYCKFWRSGIIEFMERSHLDYFELRALFLTCDITGLENADWAIGNYQRDWALAFFPIAQRFLV